jgi:SAM-dependent methyltransferase
MFTDGEDQNLSSPTPRVPTLGAARWDARYGAETAVWSPEPNVFIAELVQQFSPHPSGHAVDLGAGEGRHAIWLAGLGWHVEAVDFSEVGLAKGEKNAGSLNERITWTVADALTWTPAPASIDLVVLAYLQLTAEESAIVISNVASGLTPGGHIVWVSHDLTNLAEGTGGPPMPEMLQAPKQVRTWLGSAGLTVEMAETRARPIDGAPRPALDCIAVATK